MKLSGQAAIAVAAMLAMSGCGGDDGGGGSPSPPPAVQKIAFTSPATTSVVENESGTFYALAARNPKGGTISYRIEGGPDAGSFVLEGTGLRFDTVPNFDRPQDANRDNVYMVTLAATAGADRAILNLAVTIANDKEGIAVTRIATGLVDPVGMSSTLDRAELIVAQRDGTVFHLDGRTGALQRDTDVDREFDAGEVLAVVSAYPDMPRSKSIILLVRDATEGLSALAVNAHGSRSLKLAGPSSLDYRASLFRDPDGLVLAAVGDPSGNFAQNSGSGLGKLFSVSPSNPFADPSQSVNPYVQAEQIGDGIQNPGGGGFIRKETALADRGSTVLHELNLFLSNARPLDFGWPFREGNEAVRTNPPAAVNGPVLVYPFGTGRLAGEGIIMGVDYLGAIPGLKGQFVFGDSDGTIWSIKTDLLFDGFLRTVDVFERRTEDFEPDQGAIDSPVAFALDEGGTIYILDTDGEVFRVDQS